ncbi:MAG TPA: hypothetical protein DCG75_02720 [Bacteroidales bacterium]|nr:hypothetical protein [Bacteroidales bacterium]
MHIEIIKQMKRTTLIIIVFIVGLLFTTCNKTGKDKEFVKKVQLNQETIAVGIYRATGYEYNSINLIAEALKIDAGIVYVTLTDADVLKTKLENIDVIIFPEIENGQIIDQLDDELAEIFKNFISKKGAIALCNGSCIMLKAQDCQTLDLVDLNFEKDSMNNSLLSRTSFNLNENGEKIFPELKGYKDLYMDKCDNNIVETDTLKGNKILGFMSNSETANPIFITSKFNSGKIFISNTHPETTPGMRWMIPRIVRWVYNQEFIFYNKKVFRPDYYTNELIFDDEKAKKLQKLELQLEKGKKDEVIEAMDELEKFSPYLVAEKIRHLLAEKNNEIKLRAAKFLVDIEYTLAIEDLKKVIKTERSKKVKEQLNLYLYDLEGMLEQN